jgi:arylsulfatase A-like enzyme
VAGLRLRALTDLLDLAPTIADVFGLLGQGGSDRAFSGRSLLPVLFGAPGKPAVFARNAAGERPSYAIRDGRFAFLRSSRYGQEELYDDVNDPRETRDLVGKEPLEAAWCRLRLFHWLAGLRRGEDDAAVQAQLTPEERGPALGPREHAAAVNPG